jgi:magnesium-transporting ATPase (P-type)
MSHHRNKIDLQLLSLPSVAWITRPFKRLAFVNIFESPNSLRSNPKQGRRPHSEQECSFSLGRSPVAFKMMIASTANSTALTETLPHSGEGHLASGLTSDEARARLAKYGPNAMPDIAIRPWRMALAKFWAPVPWMLEAAIILQAVLHEYVEAAVIAGLLVFNAALGFFQEGRAQATPAVLKSRLALNASVRRDGSWKTVLATELVPGDSVKLSQQISCGTSTRGCQMLIHFRALVLRFSWHEVEDHA